ncbi:MAG TPA: DUF4127 family protein [bacterium]|nr:DUF4127 family protein [bacterium]
MRIAFLPLDDRPVTRGAFLRLGEIAGVEVATPPRALLGARRRPADVEALWVWIDADGADADLLIASAELLIYGGLVPSRIGDEPLDRCLALAGRFARLRHRSPRRRVWLAASNLRLPSTPDASEEPEYWAEHGPQIFAYSYHADRFAQTGDPASQRLAAAAEGAVPKPVLADVMARRARNLAVLLSLVDQAAGGEIDGLLIGQDDAAEFGLTRRDLRAVETAIVDRGAGARAWITYGTDELGVRLLARALLAARGQAPGVGAVYAYPEHRDAIPRYEGQRLDQTVTSHIATSGCRRADGGGDLTLFLHNFPGVQEEAPAQEPYDPELLAPFLRAVSAAAARGQRFGIADIRYSNGADRTFVQRLLQAPRAYGTLAYGGWNTSSNTIGMVLAQMLLPHGPAAEAFTMTRFLDDWAYQAGVRQRLASEIVPRYPGAASQRLGPALGPCAEAARVWLQRDYVPPLERCFGRRITITKLAFPWERLFEVDLEIVVQ